MIVRRTVFAVLLAVSGCNGINFGDSPGPDVRKEVGPLTVPPPPAQDRVAH